jgi:hypothetical protein
LLFTQFFMFFCQSCDEENCCCNFVSHGSKQPTSRTNTIKRKQEKYYIEKKVEISNI